jgi:hypothetical protein
MVRGRSRFRGSAIIMSGSEYHLIRLWKCRATPSRTPTRRCLPLSSGQVRGAAAYFHIPRFGEGTKWKMGVRWSIISELYAIS